MFFFLIFINTKDSREVKTAVEHNNVKLHLLLNCNMTELSGIYHTYRQDKIPDKLIIVKS